MTKVYTLVVNNYDALDGYMTSTDIKVFTDKVACLVWSEGEAKRQAEKGFKLTEQSDPEYWEFVKETPHGDYRHVLYGQYREVIQ